MKHAQRRTLLGGCVLVLVGSIIGGVAGVRTGGPPPYPCLLVDSDRVECDPFRPATVRLCY
jgi:hypothetical protein